ncbi:type II toxin-antitoxin system HicA family toxin [Patescibacteria group bacterium]|nr:type II toxin-antitoxin system HicA family toxin [Patescibacteria group bacterium]MDE1944650.1 type II toxin-antitoxin system HicA family toxin [Patescibacteria group bacterium]
MAGVSARTLCRALEREGYIFQRQKGSHRIYYREHDKRRVTVPMHTGDLPESTLRSILKQSGLSSRDL